MAHILLDSTESYGVILFLFVFWTDFFGNLSLELVYSKLEQFRRGGGGSVSVVIKCSA